MRNSIEDGIAVEKYKESKKLADFYRLFLNSFRTRLKKLLTGTNVNVSLGMVIDKEKMENLAAEIVKESNEVSGAAVPEVTIDYGELMDVKISDLDKHIRGLESSLMK